MKKILFAISLFLAGVTLVSCNTSSSEIIAVTHQEVFDSLSIGYQGTDSSLSVTQDIILPTLTEFNGVPVTVNWISAKTNVISTSGAVTRPTTGNTTVLLVLEVTINSEKDEKSFSLTVIGLNDDNNNEDKFTITFNSNGGSPVTSVQVPVNALIPRPTNPVKEGYNFTGWYKDINLMNEWVFTNTPVTANVTLYAGWERRIPSFTVTFETNGGTSLETLTIKEGGKISKPKDPSKDGYQLLGWYKESNFTTLWVFETDTVVANVTLYANWEKIIVYYMVSFNSVGGSFVASVEVEADSLLTPPVDPTRSGYDFMGWYTSDAYVTAWNFSTDKVNDVKTLFAKWYPKDTEPNQTLIQVNYNTMQGQPLSPDFVVVNSKLIEVIPVRAGFGFEGWFTDESYGTAWDFDNGIITQEITLYAKWKELPPQLPTPVNGANITPSQNHIGIGPYVGGEGYIGKLELVFTNTSTKVEYIDVFNAPAGVGYAYWYTNLNLPFGHYSFKFRALADEVVAYHSNYFLAGEFDVPKTNLPKPSLAIIGKTLTWGAVTNATSYEVYINNELQVGNTSPFDLSILTEAGIYTLKVNALANDYNSSEATIEYTVVSLTSPALETPTNLVLTNTTLSWDAVSNAVRYTVTIDGVSKTVTTNSLDVSAFDKTGNQTVYVVAIGDAINYLDSEAGSLEIVMPDLLPRLNPMAAGDQNGNINGYNNGYYNLIVHTGHAPFLQADWNKTFRFELWDGTNKLGELIGGNGQSLHTPGSSTDFYGARLTNGNVYKLHIILLAKPDSGHRESLPFIFEFTFTK